MSIKITLEFDGDEQAFSNAVCEMDDQFEFLDSLIWTIDYEEEKGSSLHRTKYGDIKLTKEKSNEQD